MVNASRPCGCGRDQRWCGRVNAPQRHHPKRYYSTAMLTPEHIAANIAPRGGLKLGPDGVHLVGGGASQVVTTPPLASITARRSFVHDRPDGPNTASRL